uniref:Uncharacterized protein n=1 Tax=Rhipicephalus zambeziensis TaxID=60191 RepID=A0A224YBU6_9ACAR
MFVHAFVCVCVYIHIQRFKILRAFEIPLPAMPIRPWLVMFCAILHSFMLFSFQHVKLPCSFSFQHVKLPCSTFLKRSYVLKVRWCSHGALFFFRMLQHFQAIQEAQLYILSTLVAFSSSLRTTRACSHSLLLLLL